MIRGFNQTATKLSPRNRRPRQTRARRSGLGTFTKGFAAVPTTSNTMCHLAPTVLVVTSRDASGHSQSNKPTDPNYRPLVRRRCQFFSRHQADSSMRGVLHNHPSGDPTPSRADIQMTQSIVEIAKPLGIAVHDHIIVGKEGHASFKGLKLI
jgi:hypothetical protein